MPITTIMEAAATENVGAPPGHSVEIHTGPFFVRCSCGWVRVLDDPDAAEKAAREHGRWMAIRIWDDPPWSPGPHGGKDTSP